MTETPAQTRRPRREAIINAPWCVTGLILVLALCHAARVVTHTSLEPFAATSADLAASHILPFVTYQFVHAGWLHLMMNCAFILAFGAPVARYFGTVARASLVFIAFFIVCGLVAGLGYGWLTRAVLDLFHAPQPPWALVGASGAASGLMGGAVRLMQGRGRLGPLRGRTVAGMSGAWVVINIVLGVSGVTPGAGDIPVAWEAHIIGYFAGLFLIGPFGVLSGARRVAHSS